MLDETGAYSALDGLDQSRVLTADLVVERDQLTRGLVVHLRAEEVVEETDGALGRFGPDRTIERFAKPG